MYSAGEEILIPLEYIYLSPLHIATFITLTFRFFQRGKTSPISNPGVRKDCFANVKQDSRKEIQISNDPDPDSAGKDRVATIVAATFPYLIARSRWSKSIYTYIWQERGREREENFRANAERITRKLSTWGVPKNRMEEGRSKGRLVKVRRIRFSRFAESRNNVQQARRLPSRNTMAAKIIHYVGKRCTIHREGREKRERERVDDDQEKERMRLRVLGSTDNDIRPYIIRPIFRETDGFLCDSPRRCGEERTKFYT